MEENRGLRDSRATRDGVRSMHFVAASSQSQRCTWFTGRFVQLSLDHQRKSRWKISRIENYFNVVMEFSFHRNLNSQHQHTPALRPPAAVQHEIIHPPRECRAIEGQEMPAGRELRYSQHLRHALACAAVQ